MPRRASHAACLLATVLLLGASTAPAYARMVFIAPASHAAFSVRLFWVKHIRGQFDTLYGNIDWSAARQQGVVQAWIAVASARMRHPHFRSMLLGPDFLDAARYPRIHFVSDPFGAYLLHHGGVLQGRLSMHGVTRPVAFTLQPSRCPEPGTGDCTLRLRGSIRRSRFGIRHHDAIISDRVRLNLVIMLSSH